MATKNYLYGIDLLPRVVEMNDNIQSDDYDDENKVQTTYLGETLFSFKMRSKLLSMSIFEITVRIARA